MAATVRIDLVDDADAEGLEHFAFVLSNPQGATVPEPSARVTIAPSDGPTLGAPYVFARAAAAGEADGWMDVTIGLSAPSPNEVRVNYGFDAGSAVYSGSARDFSAYSGVLVFPPGQTTHTLRVLIEDNSTPEPTEGFWLDLSAGANAVVGQRWTPLTVVDNDASSGIPAVSVTDAIVDEGAGLASFFVSLSKPATSAVSVGYGTQDGSAVAGADYRAASGTLVFQPGEVVKTVQVEIHDDGLAEADERFHLSLGSPNGLTVGDGIGVGWIGRSDGQSVSRPSVSALPVVASEADGRLEFIVQLSAASGNEVRVNFSFDAGTALYSDSSADFRAYSGTLVYAPGETTKSLTVLLVDDTVSEGDEVFSLDLGSAVNAIVPQRYVQATILDDDGASTVFSGGRGDDLYRVSNALDQITESPRGGIDTVISSISYTLPENVENLVLSGSALNALGNGGDNVFRGTSADNLFDGKGGVDTVVFSGPRAAYAVSGTVASRTVTSALDGRDTLLSIERLQFTDVLVAEDTSPGGNVWLAYAMLNAAFDTAPDTTTLSRWTAWLDREGGSADALAQAMINFYAPGVPDDVLVQHLWGTIVEAPLPLDALATYVGLVRDGTYTQAGLLSMVTTLDLNTVEIAGIVGQPLVLDPAWFPPPGA
jgi:hypothetical protein